MEFPTKCYYSFLNFKEKCFYKKLLYPLFVLIINLGNYISCNFSGRKILKKDRLSNEILNFKELITQKTILESYPQKVYVELTRNCNLNCIMCSKKKTKYNNSLDMPFFLFKRIANSLFPYVYRVELRGCGESTQLKNFLKYVQYAKKFPCQLSISTNLAYVNDEILKSLAKNDFKIGISFDGATKETFEYIRKGGDYDTVLANIRKLGYYLEKYKKSKENINLCVTVQKKNLEEIPAIITLAAKLNIKYVNLLALRSLLDNPDNLRFYKLELAKVLKKVSKLAKNKKIKISFYGDFYQKLGKTQLRCCVPWTIAYITYKGDIGPCNCEFEPPLILGNMVRYKFEDVWNNYAFRFFRRTVNTPFKLPMCRRCFKNKYLYWKNWRFGFEEGYKKLGLLTDNI